MSEDKPLHVQVAEALGWENIREEEAAGGMIWLGYHPDFSPLELIPRYDTDWSAAGPLIEKYQIQVYRPYLHYTWGAGNGELSAWAKTPLIAVLSFTA